MIKRLILLAILLGLVGAWASTAWSQNPFTPKPETQHKAPEPLFKIQIFVKLILWQQQLSMGKKSVPFLGMKKCTTFSTDLDRDVVATPGGIHKIPPGVATRFMLKG
jgi:hypothetical protein